MQVMVVKDVDCGTEVWDVFDGKIVCRGDLDGAAIIDVLMESVGTSLEEINEIIRLADEERQRWKVCRRQARARRKVFGQSHHRKNKKRYSNRRV